MTPGVKNVSPDKVRDIGIMARKGKSWAYIQDIIGCADGVLHGICDLHGIVIVDAPLPPDKPVAPIKTDPAPPPVVVRNLSVRKAKAERQRKERKGRLRRRLPPDQVRSATLGVITTEALSEETKAQAAARNVASGLLLHRIIAAISARDLWSDILDSNPVLVASASHPNQNNETQ